MATTTQGFPYPVPTDPIAGGADAIKNLAQKIDDVVGVFACGVVTATGTGTNTATANVTFPAGRFPTTPFVVCIATSGVSVWVVSATATGCVLGVKRTDDGVFSSSHGINWVAIQQ